MLLSIFAVALVAFWLVFVGLARIAGFDVSVWAPRLGSLAADRLFDVTRASATAAGVLAGVFAIVYAYRKQRVQEAAGKREDSQQLSQRYQDAAEQIGHEKDAVVLAGVYAMSRLADDWTDQRQQCVDVLCAYLRLSAESDSGGGKVVQRAIVDEILNHTKIDRTDGKSWSELRLDLSGARIDGLKAFNHRFANLVLQGAHLYEMDITLDSELDGSMNLRDAHVYGHVSLGLEGRGWINAWGMHVHEGGRFQAGGHGKNIKYSFGTATIDLGGFLGVTVPVGSAKNTFDFYGMTVAGELSVYGTGESCEPGSVNIKDIQTINGGRLTFQKEIVSPPCDAVKPGLRELDGVKAGTVTLGPWEVVDD